MLRNSVKKTGKSHYQTTFIGFQRSTNMTQLNQVKAENIELELEKFLVWCFRAHGNNICKMTKSQFWLSIAILCSIC